MEKLSSRNQSLVLKSLGLLRNHWDIDLSWNHHWNQSKWASESSLDQGLHVSCWVWSKAQEQTVGREVRMCLPIVPRKVMAVNRQKAINVHCSNQGKTEYLTLTSKYLNISLCIMGTIQLVKAIMCCWPWIIRLLDAANFISLENSTSWY